MWLADMCTLQHCQDAPVEKESRDRAHPLQCMWWVLRFLRFCKFVLLVDSGASSDAHIASVPSNITQFLLPQCCTCSSDISVLATYMMMALKQVQKSGHYQLWYRFSLAFKKM